MDEKVLLNWRQACVMLGCSKSFFYNLINAGVIPAIRHGAVKGVRVYRSDCAAYLRQREMSS